MLFACVWESSEAEQDLYAVARYEILIQALGVSPPARSNHILTLTFCSPLPLPGETGLGRSPDVVDVLREGSPALLWCESTHTHISTEPCHVTTNHP